MHTQCTQARSASTDRNSGHYPFNWAVVIAAISSTATFMLLIVLLLAFASGFLPHRRRRSVPSGPPTKTPLSPPQTPVTPAAANKRCASFLEAFSLKFGELSMLPLLRLEQIVKFCQCALSAISCYCGRCRAQRIPLRVLAHGESEKFLSLTVSLLCGFIGCMLALQSKWNMLTMMRHL